MAAGIVGCVAALDPVDGTPSQEGPRTARGLDDVADDGEVEGPSLLAVVVELAADALMVAVARFQWWRSLLSSLVVEGGMEHRPLLERFLAVERRIHLRGMNLVVVVGSACGAGANSALGLRELGTWGG